MPSYDGYDAFVTLICKFSKVPKAVPGRYTSPLRNGLTLSGPSLTPQGLPHAMVSDRDPLFLSSGISGHNCCSPSLSNLT